MRAKQIAVLVLVVWPPAALAQHLSARVAVQKDKVYVGEPFIFSVSTVGGSSLPRPDLSRIADFAVDEIGIDYKSGRSAITFRYRLTALREGDLVIPAITIRSGRELTQTVPVPVRAITPPETDEFQFAVSASKRRWYAGQPIHLTATLAYRSQMPQLRFDLPLLTDERFKIVRLGDPAARRISEEQVWVFLEGSRAVGRKGNGTVSLGIDVIARVAGRVELPAASAFIQSKGIPYRIASPPVLLDIVQPPEAGQPANFTGLIGRYEIEMEATPRKVRVGDPISLRLRVSAPSHLTTVNLPPLTSQAALLQDLQVSSDALAGSIERGSGTLTSVVRPRHERVRRIPALQFSYFDPDRERYLAIRTRALPIEVEPARMIAVTNPETSVVLPALAENYTELSSKHRLLQEAEKIFQRASALAPSDANTARALFLRAALRFERVLEDSSAPRGRLHYNAGNSYFLMGDLGRAILHYRKAERLLNADSRLAQNLRMARERVGGNFTPGLVATLWRKLSDWTSSASGVVLEPETIGRKGTGDSYAPSFERPLPAGTEFSVIETRKGWHRVELRNGEICWLPSASVELVDAAVRSYPIPSSSIRSNGVPHSRQIGAPQSPHASGMRIAIWMERRFPFRTARERLHAPNKVGPDDFHRTPNRNVITGFSEMRSTLLYLRRPGLDRTRAPLLPESLCQ